MRPGQRQTILSSVRHHRYTSYHFIPRNSHSKDGWNGYIDYLCRDRRTKPRTLLPIGRTYLTNERDRIHQHRRLGFPIFRTAKKAGIWLLFPLLEVHAAVASLPPTMRRKPIKSTIWKDYDKKQLNLLILFTLPIFVPDL